jgi:MFS family permease
VVQDIRTGVRVVRSEKFLRYMTGWISVTNLVGNSFILLVIALLEQQGVTPHGIGVTTSVVLVGGVAGSVLAGWVLHVAGARRVFLIGGWAYVLCIAATGLGQSAWQVAVAAGLFVLCSVPTASVWEAYTAGVVPDDLVGRVSAVSAFAAQSLAWVGLLLAGWLADRYGPSTALLLWAGLLVPFAVAGHLTRSLDLLRLRLHDVVEISPPADPT